MPSHSPTLHEQTLKQVGSRVTTGRLAVLGILTTATKPLSIEAIQRQLSSVRMNLATLYRIMKSLTSAGLIRSVEFQHGHAHYELVDQRRHHHHFICDNCGRVIDLTIKSEQALIASLTRTHGFSVRDHSLELFGLCQSCRQAARLRKPRGKKS